MKFTLYIDESGDFETLRGEWVLAGVLFSESYENCENVLTRRLSSLPRKLGLRSIKDFHLTDFRRDLGHEKAVEIAKKLYKKIDSIPIKYYGIAGYSGELDQPFWCNLITCTA